MTKSGLDALDELLLTTRVLVCCGSGGVGKTTVAATLALRAAALGRRAVVITIDPAKRLADALGLGELANEPEPVTLTADMLITAANAAGTAGRSRRALSAAVGGGSLHACMLDTKATFDTLVRRQARDAGQAEGILGNRFYRNISASLGGTQEYMAAERVQELVSSDYFDLVVVDTPPSRNALDFLSAPERLTRMLDNRVFRVLMAPARGGLRIVGSAAQVMLRSVGKVLGGEVMADAIAFFQAFEGMEDGFRDRAESVLELLRGGDATWVLVTTAREDALEEATWFAQRVGDLGVRVRLLVANRIGPRPGPLPAEPASRDATVAPVLAVLRAAHELARRADLHDALLAPLAERLGGVPMIRIPLQPVDVHDLASLAGLLQQ